MKKSNSDRLLSLLDPTCHISSPRAKNNITDIADTFIMEQFDEWKNCSFASPTTRHVSAS